MIKKNVQGFTLSEVLLVLSVIGVIAALTIPTLVQKVNDDQYSTALKKAFSSFSQATNMIIANEGIADNTYSSSMFSAYAKYMSFIKTDTAGNLFSNGTGYYSYKSSTVGWNMAGDSHAAGVTADGTIYRFAPYQACNGGPYGAGYFKGGYIGCADIFLDINGRKPPNMYGKDFFMFFILQTPNGGITVAPAGAWDNSTCSIGGNQGCTAAALMGTLP